MVHHIYPVSEYPELEFVQWNLLPLTNAKHNTFHDRVTDKVIGRGLAWQRKRKKEFDEFYKDRAKTISKEKEFKVTIVWGCPGSGKTTYVKKNKKHGDLVIDLDYINQAISLAPKTAVPENLLPVSLKVRDTLYDLVKRREHGQCNAWIVAGLPKRYQRVQLHEKVLADDMIYIDSTKEQCIKNAMQDYERLDKQKQKLIIENWWRDYES